MHSGNSWSWQMVDSDGKENTSGTGFPTLADCILDAGQHGFVPWPTGEERRQADGNRTLE